jgi:hypothetical protein
MIGQEKNTTNKTKQNKTKQNKTKQNKTKQNKTKQNKTKQNKTKQNKTKSVIMGQGYEVSVSLSTVKRRTGRLVLMPVRIVFSLTQVSLAFPLFLSP